MLHMYCDLTRPFMHLYPTCVDMISRPNSVCTVHSSSTHSQYDLWHHPVQMLQTALLLSMYQLKYADAKVTATGCMDSFGDTNVKHLQC